MIPKSPINISWEKIENDNLQTCICYYDNGICTYKTHFKKRDNNIVNELFFHKSLYNDIVYHDEILKKFYFIFFYDQFDEESLYIYSFIRNTFERNLIEQIYFVNLNRCVDFKVIKKSVIHYYALNKKLDQVLVKSKNTNEIKHFLYFFEVDFNNKEYVAPIC